MQIFIFSNSFEYDDKSNIECSFQVFFFLHRKSERQTNITKHNIPSTSFLVAFHYIFCCCLLGNFSLKAILFFQGHIYLSVYLLLGCESQLVTTCAHCGCMHFNWIEFIWSNEMLYVSKHFLYSNSFSFNWNFHFLIKSIEFILLIKSHSKNDE